MWNDADQTISTTTIKTEPSEVPKQSIETETHETEHIGVPKMGIFWQSAQKEPELRVFRKQGFHGRIFLKTGMDNQLGNRTYRHSIEILINKINGG